VPIPDDLPLPPSLLALSPYVLSLTGRAARAGAVEAAGRHGLSLGHVAVLASLNDFGPAAQRELCERLRQDPSDMVALIDGLEERGLVRRDRDPDDRRRHRVTLTAAGRRAQQRALGAMMAIEAELLAPLTDRERAQLRRLVTKVLAGADPRVGQRPSGRP
jgi:MarR family transcriptional regulator, lower aerobic nicotinate degradation pathway regulator